MADGGVVAVGTLLLVQPIPSLHNVVYGVGAPLRGRLLQPFTGLSLSPMSIKASPPSPSHRRPQPASLSSSRPPPPASCRGSRACPRTSAAPPASSWPTAPTRGDAARARTIHAHRPPRRFTVSPQTRRRTPRRIWCLGGATRAPLRISLRPFRRAPGPAPCRPWPRRRWPCCST